MILCKAGARQEDRLGRLPRPAGRPARARDRGQGGGAAGSPPASCFAERQRRTLEGARALAARALAARAHGVNVLTGGTDVHLVLVDLRELRAGAERQAGRGPPARDRDHRQPQRRALRPAPADGGLGPAHRHARAGHAGAARRGLRRGRADPRDRARRRVRGPRPASSPSGCRRSSSATRCTRASARGCAREAYAARERRRSPAARAARDPAPAMLCGEPMAHPTELDALYALPGRAAVTALLTPLTMRLARAVGRDRRAARAGAVRTPDAAARRPCDLRRHAGRGADLAAGRLRRITAPVARRAARRRVITLVGRAR